MRIFIKPTKLVQLKDLKNQLVVQQRELKRVGYRVDLLKNRINFRTSLVDAFQEGGTFLTA